MLSVIALLGALLGGFPAPGSLPAPTTVYRELGLTVDAPAVPHGQPWLHVNRDGADWGGYWHLMGWQATPTTGPDYTRLTLYLVREPPGNGKLVAFAVSMPAYRVTGAVTRLRIDASPPAPAATAANRDAGLGALWWLCEGAP